MDFVNFLRVLPMLVHRSPPRTVLLVVCEWNLLLEIKSRSYAKTDLKRNLLDLTGSPVKGGGWSNWAPKVWIVAFFFFFLRIKDVQIVS